MAKIPEQEKLIITFLVCNCEIYKLDEQDALHYIHFNLLQPISRRTYYNYKRMVYRICYSLYDGYKDDGDRKDLQFFKLPKKSDFINCDQLRLLLLDVKEALYREGMRINICLSDFDELIFTQDHFVNSQNYIESVLDHKRNFMYQIKQKVQSIDDDDVNRKSLHDNATIREEYVKCGKDCCNKCRHGPYYYGYWRENGKLKKKYIGINR
jgi:hypothetical protein